MLKSSAISLNLCSRLWDILVMMLLINDLIIIKFINVNNYKQNHKNNNNNNNNNELICSKENFVKIVLHQREKELNNKWVGDVTRVEHISTAMDSLEQVHSIQ